MNTTRSKPLVCLALLSLGLLLTAGFAAAQQVPLNPSKIPQFVDPLPLLSVQTGGTIPTVVDGGGGHSYTLTMTEFDANVLPTGTFTPGQKPKTRVWGYRESTTPAPAPPAAADTYIGPVFVAQRSTFTDDVNTTVDNSIAVTYVNNLGTVNTGTATDTQVLFYRTATDQTLHWADPNGLDCAMTGGIPAPGSPCAGNYFGPVPAVAHLHGGEVPPVLDGGPDAWFLSQTPGGYTAHGHGYYSSDDPANAGTANHAIYNYPNTQEAAPIWFHDHTLGATRLNVYAGLAGAYIITDPGNPPPADLDIPAKIIPLVIQDRMFDTTGQLFFPNVGLNPEHPFWVPEFVGNVIAVNGKVWPFLEVTPAKYRFLVLNGSNARAYTLDFKVQGKGKSPTIWVISNDGGYLDNPKPVQQLTIMPGERYGVIVDFTGFAAGTTLTLQNSARTPFPGGAPVQNSTTGRVLQLRVVAAPTAGLPVPPVTTFIPTAAANLRPTNAIQRLVNVATGAPAAGVTIDQTRLLTLNEVIGAGGPLEILVNNTKWSGLSLGTSIRPDFTAVTIGTNTTYYSELPQEGETELWEIVNTTADAHPIHLHLVQFQIMNRQAFNLKAYTPVYDAAFPGGVYLPGYGPPLNYNTGNLNALGGNPSVTPFLVGAAAPPLPQEQGWKDTVIMYPGEVTRIMVRWTPTDVLVGTSPTTAAAAYPFDPDALGHGYVWHCHIVDHEDNEMMRPTQVQPNGAAVRTFVQGIDY